MIYEHAAVVSNPNVAEQLQVLRNDCSPEVNQQYDALLYGLAEKTRDRQDPYLQALCTGLLDEMDTSVDFHEILLLYVAENPTDKVPVSVRKIYSSFQELVMPMPVNPREVSGREKALLDENYPNGYDTVAKWQPIINAIKQDPVEAFPFRLNLISKQLQSNILSRFAVLVAAPQLFGVSEPNFYSGGCSFGLVEKMAALYRNEAEELPSYQFGLLAENKKRKVFNPSENQTQAFMQLLNSDTFKLGNVLGVDLDPPKDPLTRSYAFSNCFRGPEFNDQIYRRVVADLLFQQPDNMRIITGDYSRQNHVESVRKQAADWFRLPNRWVEFVSTQYQLSPEDRAQADANARELAGDDGYIIHMDFAERDEATKQLYYLPRWPNWSYNLFVTPPDGTPLHIFRMRNGRALDIAPGEDLKKVVSDGDTRLEFGVMR